MKRSVWASMAIGVAVALAGTAAEAADAASASSGKSAGDLMLRLRGIGVIPDESSSVKPIGGKVDAENVYVPEIDLTYFFTDNIAVEVIAATTSHDVKDKNSTLGNVNLGSVDLLPPTVTLQYHFMPKKRFSPYVGAGLNYTFFYNEDAPGGAVTSIDYENGFGYALQAGLDYNIDGNWYLNADVKKLWLNTDVKINGGAITADVDLDPWIVGVGVGYKF